MKVFLDILIPTYNRSEYLIPNLIEINGFISNIKSDKRIRIIISDNASTDDTAIKIKQLLNDKDFIETHYYKNLENIGLKNNILKTLSYSESEYIMFIGDDDFISMEYWLFILGRYVESNKIGLILPSRVARNPPFSLNEVYITGKEVTFSSHKNNNFNKVTLSAACNQLSGILYYNNNLYDRATSTGLDNLYPFMAFAGWSLENRKGIRITNNPILVTEGVKKDWGYDNDGLLIDILDNVKYFSEYFYRFVNEMQYTWIWRDRIQMNIVIGDGIVKRGLIEIFNSEKLLLSTKFFYLIVLCFSYPKFFLYKITGRLVSPHHKQ
jgi:abequosyltransferase